MEMQESRSPVATLTRRVEAGATATQIADAMVSAWQEIDVALSPLIGKGGVAALYKRTLFLTTPAHPWLAGIHEGTTAAIDLWALKSVIAKQSGVVAAAGGGALLQTFYELLTSLVGPSLTERLLRSVWTNSLSGQPAQDTSP
jgi:hypothetical protein